MLKKETESQQAHRIFKWYKATGKFPDGTSILQCYNLLCKYNYFIAKGLDKVMINKLTEICNLIENQHYIILYGDFLLESLRFGLNNFKLTQYNNIQIRYIDCSEQSPIKLLSNSILLASHNNSYIIYICDNAESISKKDQAWFVKNYKYFSESNKTVIFAYFQSEKIPANFPYIKIRFGETYSEQLSYQKLILDLFTNPNRMEVLEKMLSYEERLSFILTLVFYNFFSFFPDHERNLRFLTHLSTFLHKSDDTKVIYALVYGIELTKTKHVIRFPPRPKTTKPSDIDEL